MSENKKRFNLIDLVIILVVIAVVLVAWKFFGTGSKKTGDIVEYKVAVLKTYDQIADQIQVGDKIFDSVKNFEIGEVTAISETQAQESVYDKKENVFKTVNVPERKDIIISVKGIGTSNESGTIVNGYELYVGKKMYIKGSNFATEAITWEIGGDK